MNVASLQEGGYSIEARRMVCAEYPIYIIIVIRGGDRRGALAVTA